MTVSSLVLTAERPYENGRTFGDVGAYERIDATVHYAVDPTADAHRAIVDLDLAERSSDGLVHFSGDAVILRPADPASANRFCILDVPNRGRRGMTGLFNRAAVPDDASDRIVPGDGFLMQQGFTLAWVGWQWDVPRSTERMGLEAPLAARAEPGPMQLRLQLPVDTHLVSLTDQHVGPLGGHESIPPGDLDDPDAVLYVRERLADTPRPLPRAGWHFTTGGELAVDDGLRAGLIYDLVYRVGPGPVVGAGLLAVRDLASFLRSDRTDNPAAASTDRVILTGISQNSRFLRHLLSLGLDVDVDGSPAFDGVLGVVGGGRRGEFNHRGGQPSVQPTPSFGHLFPFADLSQHDARTGRTAGLLDAQTSRPNPPKIMFTDTSAEYWRGDASLAHTSVVDGSDVEDAPFVRRYLFSGTQHGAGEAKLQTHTAQGSRGANPLNLVDYLPLYRCALMNLVAWIGDGIEPPPSAVPRWADGNAASRADVLSVLDAIPMALADVDALPVIRSLDLGPDAASGVGRYPAVPLGDPYPTAVSAVDNDGNEIAGVPMPDVSVPVATNIGFNPRHPDLGGAGQILEYFGSSVPFARTAAERATTGDPRPAIGERYIDLDDYLAKIRVSAEKLVTDRRLLEQDVELCIALARRRYLLVTSGTD